MCIALQFASGLLRCVLFDLDFPQGRVAEILRDEAIGISVQPNRMICTVMLSGPPRSFVILTSRRQA